MYSSMYSAEKTSWTSVNLTWRYFRRMCIQPFSSILYCQLSLHSVAEFYLPMMTSWGHTKHSTASQSVLNVYTNQLFAQGPGRKKLSDNSVEGIKSRNI